MVATPVTVGGKEPRQCLVAQGYHEGLAPATSAAIGAGVLGGWPTSSTSDGWAGVGRAAGEDGGGGLTPRV